MTLDAVASDYEMAFDENSVLPFKDNSLKVIYSAHNLEHLDERDS